MSIWEKIKLGDAATFINGFAFKPTDWTNKGRKIIRIQNLTKSRSEANYYEGELDEKYCVKKGDLLISWSATLGVFEWHENPGWLNQHIFKVVFDKKEFDKCFFKYLIFQMLHRMEKEVHGATMKHITKKIFDNLIIPYPPLSEQKRIAAILDEADRLRQKDKQLIEQYNRLAQSVFLDMFGDPVTNSKEFDFVELKELCKVSQGLQIAINKRCKEPGCKRYKYLTVAYLNGRKKVEYVENPRESVICYNDDVLMTRTGNTGQVVTNVTGVFHNNFFKVDYDREKLNKSFFVSFLRNPNIKRELIKRASTTTIPDLNHNQFYSLKIPLPERSFQNSFEDIATIIESQKKQAEKSLVQSEALFNSLLQKAFKGEL